MFTSDQLNQLSTLISESQHFVVMFPQQASFDIQAATSGLVHSIQLLGNKVVNVVTPNLEKVENTVFGSVEVKDELGNKTLQISFPYQAEKVDKVSYNIDDENKRFYLSVQPQKGQKPLDYQELEFAYVGTDADLIIVVGVSNYDSLEQLYFGYEDMFKDTTVVSLNTYETTMGNVKLNASGMSSLSEAVTMILRSLSMPVPGEAATQLLSGMEQATKGFSSYSATADTFESVGFLLRQGARRVKKPTPQLIPASREVKALPTPALPATQATAANHDAEEKGTGLLSSAETTSDHSSNSFKKKSRKSGKALTLNEEKSAQGKIKPVGSLHYQPSESSMGARG